jgi:tetratricopeptide (TPR) repeat protein
VNAVLANAPDNARAHGLQTKAQDCVKAATPAAKPAAPAVAKAKLPADGGLEVKPPETQADYNRRVDEMHKRYDDAVAQMQALHYPQAKKAFDDISAQVPPGYLDLAQRRSDLQKTMQEESGRQFNQGQQAEQKEDFTSAVQHYQRARELDPSHDVSADVNRVTDKKVRRGHDACDKGNAFFSAFRNPEAAEQYSKVVELLPDSDPCVKTAKDRLQLINRR